MNIKDGFRFGQPGARAVNWIANLALWGYLTWQHGWSIVVVWLVFATVCVVLNAFWEKSWKHGARRAFGLRSKRRPFEVSPSKS